MVASKAQQLSDTTMATTKKTAATTGESTAKVTKVSGLYIPVPVSPEMKQFLGVFEVPCIEAVKKIWEYVKAKSLGTSNCVLPAPSASRFSQDSCGRCHLALIPFQGWKITGVRADLCRYRPLAVHQANRTIVAFCTQRGGTKCCRSNPVQKMHGTDSTDPGRI